MADDEKPNKKGKKVEVDEQLLKDTFKVVQDLKKELDAVKSAPQSGGQSPVQLNINSAPIMFSCQALSTIPEQSEFDKVFPNFQKELDVLMKKYHMVKVEAHMYATNI